MTRIDRSLGLGLLAPLAAAAVLALSSCGEGAKAPSVPTFDQPGLIIVRDENPEDSEFVDSRPYFHDFGRQTGGRVLRHTFRFRNQDPVPVTITNLDASCGCTVPSISYEDLEGNVVRGLPSTTSSREILTIPPGAVASLTVRLSTDDVGEGNRDKLATVRMISDSQSTRFINFEVHVVVERLFQATPTSILKHQIPVGAGASGTSDIIRALSTNGARVLGLAEADYSPLEVEVIESQRFGEPVWTLSVVFPPGMPLGPYFREIVLRTTASGGVGENGVLKIPVRAQIVPDIIVVPPTVFLGNFEASEGKTMTAELKALSPGHRILVQEARLEGLSAEAESFVKVTASAINPDSQGRSAKWSVEITVSAGELPDVLGGRVRLDLDDSQTPTVSFPFSGRPQRPKSL